MKIIDLIDHNKDNIHFIKHNDRTNPIDEINKTIEKKMENDKNATKFKKIINMTFASKLPDTRCIVYKNNNRNKNILKQVYDLLITHGLRRDQNVVQYAFLQHNSETNLNFLKPIHFKKNIVNIKKK